MDNVATYRATIRRILTNYATIVAGQGSRDVESLLVLDEERDQFLWLQVGWTQQRRVYGVTVHARICNDEIYVEQDWTEDGIATDLLRAGVPREDIVLAFQQPQAPIVPDSALA